MRLLFCFDSIFTAPDNNIHAFRFEDSDPSILMLPQFA
ncbi:MAG: hypothetical protein QOE33_1844 [Acidobacteriota bacterium]|nr:hypothetical protein [Acidobacteriota bacterium]